MDFLKILENVQLSEDQIKALDKFFTEWVDKKTKEIETKYLEESKGESGIDPEKYILREDAEKAFEKYEEHCEAAFEKFEEDCEAAFEKYEEDAEAAFNLGVEDLQKEYTENMTQALQEVYSEISDRVKTEFMESKEYKTIEKLKELAIPLIDDSSNDLIAKMKAMNEEKEKVEQDNKKLSKENAINVLLKDIPKEYVETVKNFISGGNTEEEVIERFNSICEVLETKIKGSAVKPVNEEKKPDIGNKFSRKKETTPAPTAPETKPITEEADKTATPEEKPAPSVGYETLIRKMEKEENEINAFTESEASIIDKIFEKKK